SPFREVIFLDADNVPLIDPEALFDTIEYREHGALFWPDYWIFEASDPIWQICGIQADRRRQFESGQIVIDKRRCWESLMLCRWYNEHSGFYYKYILGDKDTFQLAFLKIGKSFAMPQRDIQNLSDVVMCQHDFQGGRIFQHRNLRKWSLFGANESISGFALEDKCVDLLSDLRQRWDGRLPTQLRFNSTDSPRRERQLAEDLVQGPWAYSRVGFDHRLLRFQIDGSVSGGGDMELFWDLRLEDESPRLVLSSEHRLTCELELVNDDNWIGRWEIGEKMPVVIARRTPSIADSELREQSALLIGNEWAFRVVDESQRTLEFCEHGTISVGSSEEVAQWRLVEEDARLSLHLCTSSGDRSCRLSFCGDGVWKGWWDEPGRNEIHMCLLKGYDMTEEPKLSEFATQIVTQSQIDSEEYQSWCERLGEPPRYHRRQWEYVFSLKALERRSLVGPDSKIVSFGDSSRQVVSVLSAAGCYVDEEWEQQTEPATIDLAWDVLSHISRPNKESNIENSAREKPQFEIIPRNYQNENYSALLAISSLPRLGDHKLLESFIDQALNCVAPGGVVLATGDLSLSSPNRGYFGRGKLILSAKDLHNLEIYCTSLGHQMELRLGQGNGPVDEYCDTAPFQSDHHLKLFSSGHIVTSVGIAVQKRQDA
ncbi:MAG: hypothetical protein AAF591_20705, partial [Verrucomicrobiota bacterium]